MSNFFVDFVHFNGYQHLGKNFMAIPFVVPEILGGVEPPLPDAIKLSEKADAINR